jgi:uncharacterized membrane protein YgcG
MSLSNDIQAIPRLFADAVEQLAKLVQNEAQLARAEIGQKFGQAKLGAAYLAAAATLAIPAVVVLLIALAIWLNTAFALTPAVGHLIAGALGVVVALVLGLTGMSYLKPDNLTPKVTIRAVERDIQTAKELAR